MYICDLLPLQHFGTLCRIESNSVIHSPFPFWTCLVILKSEAAWLALMATLLYSPVSSCGTQPSSRSDLFHFRLTPTSASASEQLTAMAPKEKWVYTRVLIWVGLCLKETKHVSINGPNPKSGIWLWKFIIVITLRFVLSSGAPLWP